MYNDIPFEICEWNTEPKKLKKVEYEDMVIHIIN